MVWLASAILVWSSPSGGRLAMTSTATHEAGLPAQQRLNPTDKFKQLILKILLCLVLDALAWKWPSGLSAMDSARKMLYKSGLECKFRTLGAHFVTWEDLGKCLF